MDRHGVGNDKFGRMLNEEALVTRFVPQKPSNLYKNSVRTSQETHCFRSKDQLINAV
jgi:hypothetical protein